MTIKEFKEKYIINFYSYDKNPHKYEFYTFVTNRDNIGVVICRHNDHLNKIIANQLNENKDEIREKYMRALAHICLSEFDIEEYDPLNKKNNIHELYDESI